MSKTRIFLRVALVGLVAGAVWLGYLQWRKMYPEYYFKKADAAAEQGDHESARLYLTKLIKKHPTNADAHERLSQIILEEARANSQPARYAAQPAALDFLARASELDPDNTEVQRRLLRAYLERRDIAKAAPLAEAIYAEDKTNGDAHLALTWQAVLEEDDGATERLFEETSGVVSRHPFHELALKLSHYSLQDDDGKIEAVLVEALEVASDLEAEQLRLLAYQDREVMLQVLLTAQSVAGSGAERRDASNVIVRTCETLKEENLLSEQIADRYASRSQSLLVSGETADLNARIRQLRMSMLAQTALNSSRGSGADGDGAQPESKDHLQRAISLYRQGKSSDTLQVLKDGIAAGLDGEEAQPERKLTMHLLAARIFMDQGQFDAAREQLRHLDGHEEFSGWSYLLRGKAALRDGDYETAYAELTLAEPKLQRSLEVHALLSQVHLAQKQWPQAIPHLQALLVPDDQVSEIDAAWRNRIPGYRDRVHLDLLAARLEAGRWDDSQENLRHLKDTEFAPQAWRSTINYLWAAGDKEKARKYLELTRKKFPDYIDLVFTAAQFYREEMKHSLADFVFEEFVADKPNDPVRKLAMARWLVHTSNPDKALRILEGVRRHPQKTSKVRNTLNLISAQAHISAEQFAEADGVCEALIAEEDTAAAGYLFRSMVLDRQGDQTKARHWLVKANETSAKMRGRDLVYLSIPTVRGEPAKATVNNAYYW